VDLAQRVDRGDEMIDAEAKVLASWRANVEPEHVPGESHPIDDPTSEDLEPDLRRFERDGDGPA
jgi:hypothetical protein